MNADAAKAQIKAHGFVTVTPDVSRNAIRWLDGEVAQRRLTKQSDSNGTRYIAARKKS